MSTAALLALVLAAAAPESAPESTPADPPGDERAWALEVLPTRQIEATYTQVVDLPSLEAEEWVLYAAIPPLLIGQQEVRATLEPRGSKLAEKSPLRRRVLRARVRARGERNRHEIAIEVTYRAALRSRRLVPRSFAGPSDPDEASPATLTARERRNALRETPMYDFRTEVLGAWLDANDFRRIPDDDGNYDEDEVAFARRVFRRIVTSYEYSYVQEMDRRASFVRTAGATDCGGLSILFASIMRASAIPARVLVGRWARSAEPGAQVGAMDYYQQHAVAEFFVEGAGWAPVDPAQGVLYDETEERLEFFGRDAGDFLVLHVDPELEVDSILFGPKTLTWLQQVAFWVRGEGGMDDVAVTRGWVVEEVEEED